MNQQHLLPHAMVRNVKFMRQSPMYTTKYGFPKQSTCLLPKLKAIPQTMKCSMKTQRELTFRHANLDPLKFGWVKDDSAKSLGAIPLPQDVPLAPAEMLKTILCTCSSDQSCSSLKCGSASVQLPCSLFCKYCGSGRCFNRMTKMKDAVDDEELSGG